MSDLYPSHVPGRGARAWLRSLRDVAVTLAGGLAALVGRCER